jgi:hypothetical protein
MMRVTVPGAAAASPSGRVQPEVTHDAHRGDPAAVNFAPLIAIAAALAMSPRLTWAMEHGQETLRRSASAAI